MKTVIEINDVTHKKLKILASRSGMSLKEVINTISSKYIREFEEKNGTINTEKTTL